MLSCGVIGSECAVFFTEGSPVRERERVETRGEGRHEKHLFNNRRDFSSFAG